MQSPISPMLLPILFTFCEKAGIEYNALLRIRVGLFPKTAIAAKHHNPASTSPNLVRPPSTMSTIATVTP